MLLRLVGSFASGALLSCAGSLVQGVTQNELAGPSTLGMDALIVLVVLAAHMIGLLFSLPWALEYISFLLFLLLAGSFCIGWSVRQKKMGRISARPLSNKEGRNIPIYILFGLFFNLFVGSLFSCLQFIFMAFNLQFPSQLWFGNFRFVETRGVLLLVPYALVIFLWSVKLSKKMRPLIFGIDYGLGLGLPVEKIERQALCLSLFAEGIVGCFFGIFSFMGLIFPHFLRSFAFFRNHIEREILWGAPLCGCLFMTLDFLCYQFPLFGTELPVGMISSLIGTLFLVVFFLKKQFLFSAVEQKYFSGRRRR